MHKFLGGGIMNRKARIISLIMAAILAVSLLDGCSSRAAEAANQIESSIQDRQEKAKEFNNINAADIDAQYTMNIINELSSPKYKGRETGTKENEAAMKYISDQFKAMGLKNPEGLENYMQYYSQPVALLKETPKLELINWDGRVIKSFEYPKNFVFRLLSDSTDDININAPMQVVGNAADMKNQSFRNKEVLLFSLKAQGRISTNPAALMDKMYDTNASAIIVEVDVASEKRLNSDLIVVPLSNRGREKYKPVITVDSATYAELAQAASEQKTISLKCSVDKEKSYRAANIVGYIPGTDEKLKDEYIIIGGHMDHVGDNMNGTYNPGALDNASGTAAMMEIAKVLSENKIKPKKTLVFIAFNGEEYGLLGSAAYLSNPVFPIKKAVMINLDMVGSAAQIPLSVATGSGQIQDLKTEFLDMAKSLGITAEKSDITASDHFNFGEKDIPSVMLTHMDVIDGLHSPDDTLEDIDSERLKQVMELVLHYIDKKAY